MAQVSSECAVCSASSYHQNLSWCSVCSVVYCDTCWITAQFLHRPNNPQSTKHEKACLDLAEFVLSMLNPAKDKEEQEQLHGKSQHSKWFAIIKDESTGKGYFYDFGRFSRLAGGSSVDPGKHFPCLISFIGDTGAGKSTVINGLLKLRRNSQCDDSPENFGPVIGSSAQLHTPTSDGVHLFADPETYHTYRPLLYADCEGLKGGNIQPIAAKRVKDRFVHGVKKGTRYMVPKITRKEMIYKSEEQKTRKWAVEKLYPRILFPFSDVVCHVTRNFRAVQDQIQTMLSWADEVFGHSLNQPMLPYAIIVVNAVEYGDDGKARGGYTDWWSVDATTSDALNSWNVLVGKQSTGQLADLARKWRKRGQRINSLLDLILCYHSGFSIICIPAAGLFPPSLIKQQYERLYSELQLASINSKEWKKSLGFFMSAEELEYYLEFAVDHFPNHLTVPFNFLSAACLYNPVPTTFKNHIIKLALYFMDCYPDDSGSELFQRVAPLVASSIFLDSHRQRYPGRGIVADILERYENFCVEAQAEFYQRHWPCEKLKPGTQIRCVNVASGHSKGHQDSSGKVFGSGVFYSSFGLNPKAGERYFLNLICHRLNELISLLVRPTAHPELNAEEKAAAEVHMMHTLAAVWGSGQDENQPPVSHTTCFCCLASTPEHKLSCGHIICERCLENYSEVSRNKLHRRLKICPLCRETGSLWKAKVKPPTAGLRVLSLDGGGMRSIVQLTILKQLEQTIGLDLPIQEFFDLIIGTSGGGIVAFGLGLENQSMEKLMTIFRDLAWEAFKKRKAINWPVVGSIVAVGYHSIYETQPLIKALKSTFGEEPLFGSKLKAGRSSNLKIGVMGTSSNNQAYLLSDYNRQTPVHEDLPYFFFRGETEELELKLWEALRATSAAPSYFTSFFHQATKMTFNDGGIKYNNPVFIADKERKILWPSLAGQDPDILLSIGTGFDSSTRAIHSDPGPESEPGVKGYIKRIGRIAIDVLQSTFDCEKAWADFVSKLADNEERNKKYVRLNPDFGPSLPKFYKVKQMDYLQRATSAYPWSPGTYESIADTLIASLFYFETDGQFGTKELGITSWRYEGTIKCRLSPKKTSLKVLCERLCNREKAVGARSTFLISDGSRRDSTNLNSELLHSVATRVSNGLPFALKVSFTIYNHDSKIAIYLSHPSDPEKDSLISGFPRCLLIDDAIAEGRGQRKSNSSSSIPTVSKVRQEYQMRDRK